VGVRDMLKQVAGIKCGLVGHEIRDPQTGHQDEVELAVLFRNLPGEIGPEGASGEFDVGPDPVQCDKSVFDSGGKADTMCGYRFNKPDVDGFRTNRNLPSIPSVAHWISDGHHPEGHEGRSTLLAFARFLKEMGKHVAGAEADFLSADGDLGRGVGGVNGGSQGSHERDQKYIDEHWPHLSAKFMSVTC